MLIGLPARRMPCAGWLHSRDWFRIFPPAATYSITTKCLARKPGELRMPQSSLDCQPGSSASPSQAKRRVRISAGSYRKKFRGSCTAAGLLKSFLPLPGSTPGHNSHNALTKISTNLAEFTSILSDTCISARGSPSGIYSRTPLKEICRSYDPLQHPILGPLLENGPVGLVERYALPHRDEYADACHMCYEARLSLRSQFPEFLTPDQMYGVITS